mmetsp:Transcript_65029/g.102414  ORF Transcript_65029/g.102414 Transcript_65029/m.102414 type:complete len:134 (-) Transcript_65029:61-462(-)
MYKIASFLFCSLFIGREVQAFDFAVVTEEETDASSSLVSLMLAMHPGVMVNPAVNLRDSRSGAVQMLGKNTNSPSGRTPTRLSRVRSQGFRKRMRSKLGRAMIKRRRAKGRHRLAPTRRGYHEKHLVPLPSQR